MLPSLLVGQARCIGAAGSRAVDYWGIPARTLLYIRFFATATAAAAAAAVAVAAEALLPVALTAVNQSSRADPNEFDNQL